MSAPASRTTLYRYGRLAWVWRALMLLGAAIAAPLVVVAWRDGSGWALLTAAPLVLPSAFLAGVVAVQIDEVDEALDVRTLGGWRRRLPRRAIGPGRVRVHAQGHSGPVRAPRAFVRVRGGLPLYVDLLADIPDRPRLARVLQLVQP